MNLATWLDAKDGRTALMAAHFDVTLSAISQWRKNGVPVARMKPVREFTVGEVTLEEMVPEASDASAEG